MAFNYSKNMGTSIAVHALRFAGVAVLSIASPAVAGEHVLFRGRSLEAWQKPLGDWQAVGEVRLSRADNKHFATQPGEGVMLNSRTNHTVNLISTNEFGDCELHVEFCVPSKSNSGVYLMGRYEVQVFDSWGVAEPKSSDCGGIYASCSEPKPDYKGRPPSLNASKPPGEWQTFDITFRAPRFDAGGKKIENARFIRVAHNGKVIQENVEVPRPTCAARWLDEKARGPVMLQGDHGPVAYRNVVVRD